MTEIYDARERSSKTLTEAKDLINASATLPLTGVITDYGESDGGVWVRFELDERWGFHEGFSLVMDLDPFVI